MAKLKYIHGCMGCGKTLHIVKANDMLTRKGMKVLIIKPAVDTRESEGAGWAKTRSRFLPDKPVTIYQYSDIHKLDDMKFDILLIDEAQFMSKEDVIYVSDIVDKRNIDVRAFGLKTSATGELFEGSKALLAYANEIEEMTMMCQVPQCRNKAQFHVKTIDGFPVKATESVGVEKGSVGYISTCRKHFKELTGGNNGR